jgi:hypothetical protein
MPMIAVSALSAFTDEVPLGSGWKAMDDYSADELREALGPIDSLIGKSEKACLKLAPGTSQHSLLRNRLKALRIAESLTRTRLGED